MGKEGEKVEAVTDFIFLGSMITADNDCNHKIKRCLLLGSKAMTNLDSKLKSRDITANEDPDNQNYVFSCTDVSWTINKTEYDNSSMVSNFL